MSTEPKKPTPPKKPDLPYARRLITAWRDAALKSPASRVTSVAKITQEPGAWEALVAGLDGGVVPMAALWRFGEQVTDYVPPRFAVELLRALPDELLSLWFTYRMGHAVLLGRLREDATALDDLGRHGRDLVRDLIEVAKLHAGVSPAGSASPRVRASIGAEWCRSGYSFSIADLVDGRVVRVDASSVQHPASVDALRGFGARILGADGLVETLAAAHRERLAEASPASPLFPNEVPLVIASKGLTPEESCGFQMSFDALQCVAAPWSLDDLVRAALATAARARPDGYLVAGSAAVLALLRDPACAPRVAPALQLANLSNRASAGVAATYDALSKAPPAWLRGYITERLFAEGAAPSTWGAPVGVALLASIAPDEAEALASQHGEAIDYGRLRGVDPSALRAVGEAAGPTVRAAFEAAGLLGEAWRVEAAAP